jgi:hypothetical protein
VTLNGTVIYTRRFPRAHPVTERGSHARSAAGGRQHPEHRKPRLGPVHRLRHHGEVQGQRLARIRPCLTTCEAGSRRTPGQPSARRRRSQA